MSERSARDFLQDAKTYAVRADFLAGGTSLSMLKDVDHFDHALRSYLTIVGEALTRVPDPVKACHPGIAWAAIRGLRNRIVHACWRIDMDIVKRTIVEDVPELIAAIDVALAEP